MNPVCVGPLSECAEDTLDDNDRLPYYVCPALDSLDSLDYNYSHRQPNEVGLRGKINVAWLVG